MIGPGVSFLLFSETDWLCLRASFSKSIDNISFQTNIDYFRQLVLKPYKKKSQDVVIGKNKVRQLARRGLLTSLGLAAVPLAKICLPLVVRVHCKGTGNATRARQQKLSSAS